MAEPYQRVCPPRAPSARSPSLPVAPSWVSTPLPSTPRSDGWLACSSPSPAPRLVLVAPSPLVGALPSAPLPDVLCYDPAYENAELVLTCGACYDGIDIVVPAGQFISRVSQADADAQAQAWGESQLSCLPADPASIIPNWDDLSGDVAITQIDVYGLKGFEAYAVADMESAGRMWCTFDPALDFCDGPEIEAQPLEYGYERYSVRWKARNDGGVFSYAKVGEEWNRAPAELFPATISGAEGVSISFDANARPCFAFQVGNTIELRRFVADAPTVYSWVGASPKLFFDGLLQPDTGLRDVVCFYVSEGRVCVRMQRDNFEVEHLLSGGASAASLVKVDKGSGSEQGRHLLSSVLAGGDLALLRSAQYPLWPRIKADLVSATLSFLADGDYFPVVIATSSTDALTSVAAFLTDGDYQPVTLVVSPSDAVTGTAGFSTDGDYSPVAVGAPVSPDALSGTAALESDGNYYESVVPGGSYADASTATAAFLTDGDYTL